MEIKSVFEKEFEPLRAGPRGLRAVRPAGKAGRICGWNAGHSQGQGVPGPRRGAGGGVRHHAALCSLSHRPGKDFQVAVALPRGTNTGKPAYIPDCGDSQLLWARNKWLLTHADSAEAAQGAYLGLSGENIDLS